MISVMLFWNVATWYLTEGATPWTPNLYFFLIYCSAFCVFAVDSICKTCYCCFDVPLPRPGMQKTFTCGHNNVDKVCEMCYRRSHVLHPSPGEFAFDYHHPYHTYPTKHWYYGPLWMGNWLLSLLLKIDSLIFAILISLLVGIIRNSTWIWS